MLVDPAGARSEVGADHGLCCRHGLKLHQAERFLPGDRRQDKQIARVIQGGELFVGHVAEKFHAIGNPERCGAMQQLAALGTIADNQRTCGNAAHGLEQDIDALVAHEPSHKQHDWPAFFGSNLCRPPCDLIRRLFASAVEAVGNHHAFELPVAQLRSRGRQRRRRHDDPRRPLERELQERPVEEAIPPAGANDFTVKPHDHGAGGPRQKICQQGHGIRLMNHDQIRALGREPERQSRAHRHRADFCNGGQTNHLHSAMTLFRQRETVIGHEHGVAHGPRRAIANQLEDGFHAAARRRIELAEVEYVHEACRCAIAGCAVRV